MRTAINTRYGSPDVLVVRQVPTPEPNAGEVLIRVHATTVSRTDCGMLRPHPFFVRFVAGLRRPKRTILGMDFAGEVEAIGAGVTRFKPDDRVFGLSPDVYGAHAEYLCVPERGAIAAMPAGTRFSEAFDFVFDAVGKTTFFRCRQLLKPEGVFAATDLGPWCQNPLLTIWSAITGSHRVIFPLPQNDKAKAFVDFLKTRMEAREFRAVIDREYPLEAIADAYRYVETAQKTGIVVINVRP
jgi:NADPH:quinone reductase-like Zn-dependent oxidoreductase